MGLWDYPKRSLPAEALGAVDAKGLGETFDDVRVGGGDVVRFSGIVREIY